ncbi:Vta1 like-domain-containing protein [Daedaleopsis nitida]|nr:Vta1 like-domain-containing protein [Daedaleopsis nitida]
MVLSLPPVPPELKSIKPYLQRADEIAKNDPVISYWCAYYAAQQGIALKLKDSAARHFLFDLLGLLERMKTDLGPNDAVHDEPASAAYVENFALRVFAGADNEDRSGRHNQNTARKFAAAANFLEILRIFDSDKAAIDLASIEEKIKYAKWKAVDVARAIREGRRPMPGSPGSANPETPPVAPDVPDVSIVPPPMTPPGVSSPLPKASPPSITRQTPPPPHLANLTPADSESGLSSAPLPDGLAPPQPPQSPGSWSTAATPGTPGFGLADDATPSGSPAFHSPPESGGRTRMAFVSGELEGKTEEEIDAETTPPNSAAKSVHFSPSVMGGLETPGAPGMGGTEEDPFSVRAIVNLPSVPTFPDHPSSAAVHEYPYSNAPPIPPPQSPGARAPPHAAASPSHSHSPLHPHAHAHSVPLATSQNLGGATSTVTITPAELTPQVVARAQKHCRFAISALDYEDAEQAVKELRAALRMLGG